MFHKLKRELGHVETPKDSPVLSDDIITWTKQTRKINGKPFSFENRQYLVSLYRDLSKSIYVVKARQMEITEYSINFLLFCLTKNPGTVGLYMADTEDHVKAFSDSRLYARAIGQSDLLKSLVESHSESVMNFTNGSVLYMYSAWNNFEKARSFPADFVVIDEIQSVNAEAIPVLKETLSKSKFGRLVAIGTGSEEGDSWWKLWNTGDQKEWDAHSKSWIAKRPENFCHASSYHIGQDMASWLSSDDIEPKRDEYTPRRFANEVEGLWYKGARKPLTESEIRNLFDRNISLLSPDEIDTNMGPLFLGVDWGGGKNAYTVPWIWQCVDDAVPRFRLVYVSKITEPSTEKQADMIAELMDRYEIKQAVMDSGGGPRQVEKLSDRYGPRILKCGYITRPDEPLEIIYSENRINLDRTWAIDTIVDLIQMPQTSPGIPNGIPRIIIPAKESKKIEWIIDQFTCIESEYVDLTSGKRYVRYDHPVESPDDALHACVYAYCAFLAGKRPKAHFAVGKMGGG